MQMINTADASIPFSGWAFSRALTLDQRGARGIVADICCTRSVLKRQAAFVTLSVAHKGIADVLARLPKPAATMTEAFRTNTARELANAAFCADRIPNSFLRSLERIGNEPLSSPEDYRHLYELCMSRSGPYEALRHCHSINSARLHAAGTLDQRVLSAPVLDSINDSSDVQLIEEAIRLLAKSCSMLDTPDGWCVFRDHLARLGVFGVERMLKHADRFPPAPLPRRPELTPLSSSEEMTRVGHTFRNCLTTRIPYVLLGRSFYYVVKLAEPRYPVVVELQPLTNGAWKLHHLEGPKGTHMTPNERKQVVTFLVRMGAVVIRTPRETDKLAGLFRTYPLDFSVTEEDLHALESAQEREAEAV